MKHLLVITTVFLFLSCSKNENSKSSSSQSTSWRLVEQYMDPGDGSGDFESIESDKVIVISDDNTWLSNSSFCGMNATNSEQSSGIINSEFKIISNDCTDFDYPPSVAYENGYLMVYYQCIEACVQKYEEY